jgi:hypothetical protein
MSKLAFLLFCGFFVASFAASLPSDGDALLREASDFDTKVGLYSGSSIKQKIKDKLK